MRSCCVPGGLSAEEVHGLLLGGRDCELDLPSALSADARSIAEPTESASLVLKTLLKIFNSATFSLARGLRMRVLSKGLEGSGTSSVPPRCPY